LLETCGADDELLQAALLLDAGAASRLVPGSGAGALAVAARALSAVRWLPSGRTPAAHAREALIALAGDPRVLLLCMAERTSALRRAGRSGGASVLAAAHEVRALWAPLAARLGVHPLQHTPLRSGQVVEVLHHARSHVSAGQLTRVRTARARNRIRAALGGQRGARRPPGRRARGRFDARVHL
jgi:(p)ppGpp synthase/HD superfamily hydrolase